MVLLYENNQNIILNILWTDESSFNNNGIVNRHNSHYWSNNNPNWTRENNAQVRWSTNIWCSIINNQLVGPLIIE